jgi:ATP-binding cassette, subfamily B, bacterial
MSETENQNGADGLAQPYWHLTNQDLPKGLVATLSRVHLASMAVMAIIRLAVPRQALIVFGLQLLIGATVTLSLILINKIFEALFSSEDAIAKLHAGTPAIIALGGLFALRIGFSFVLAANKASLAPKARLMAEKQLYRATVDIPLSDFDDPLFYDQLQRARDRGILHLEGSIFALIDSVAAVFAVAGAVIALAILHPILLPLLLLPLCPAGWGAIKAARVQYDGMAKTISLMRMSTIYGELATKREMAAEIRAHQAQPFIMTRFLESAGKLCNHYIAVAWREAVVVGIASAVAGVGWAFAIALLLAMIINSWIDLAQAGAAIVAFRMAAVSLEQFVANIQMLVQKSLYISDYQSFVAAAKARRDQRIMRPAPHSPQRISVHDLSFRYPGGDGRWILESIDFTVKAGETVALVGENGSGKTTLAKLLAGLYQPQKGMVAWDGCNIAEIDPKEIADRVSMVMQHPVRWPDSARANIEIGRYREHVENEEKLLRAAEQSGALAIVEQLPQGWKTLLSREFHDGHDLSGGQWQKFAIARGLYRDCPIVIWDEPTAPLDAKAEMATYEALRTLGRGRTAFLITHRLMSIRNVDRILFLEGGRLTEQGSHDELLRLGGAYASLFFLQSELNNSGLL